MLCSLCDVDAVREIASIEGYRATTSYSVSECGACGTSSVRPCAMDPRIYEAIYNHVKDVPGYSRYYALARDIARQADPLEYIAHLEEPYFAVVEAIKSQLAEAERMAICELGCGQGYFTFALRKAGYHATGVDHSPEAIALARQRYGDYYFCGDLTEYIATLRERPQVIFACEVIEHLVDPVGFVSAALECLASGGLLAITTPNKLPEVAEAEARVVWDTELPPVHLWWFTKRSFMAIARRVNCSVSFSDFTRFYQSNERFLVAGSASSVVRSPILDQDYKLIQFAHGRRAPAPIKNAVKAFLPGPAAVALRRLQAWQRGDVRRDDETSTTIGALFRKL